MDGLELCTTCTHFHTIDEIENADVECYPVGDYKYYDCRGYEARA